jgi:hypothetical protein
MFKIAYEGINLYVRNPTLRSQNGPRPLNDDCWDDFLLLCDNVFILFWIIIIILKIFKPFIFLKHAQ